MDKRERRAAGGEAAETGVTIATVLKTGGHYDAGWVKRLEREVYEKCSTPHRFFCLSDVEDLGPWVKVVPLIHGWPGWWSKFELWREGIFPEGLVLYLDLDTMVMKGLERLVGAIDCDLMMLRDFYRNHMAASGLMGWDTRSGLEVIYERFRAAPEFRTPRGDQAVIERLAPPGRIRFWQDECPERVVSYKVHCKGKGYPGKADVVCFHGRPRPDEVLDPWVRKQWSR